MIPMKSLRLFLLLLGVVTCSFFAQMAAAHLDLWLLPFFARPALAFATLFPG